MKTDRRFFFKFDLFTHFLFGGIMTNQLVIENTTILTMNAARETKVNTSIAVTGNQIVKIGSAEEIRTLFPDARLIDGKGKVVMPGSINCHTHIAMSLQKGITMAVPDGLYRVMCRWRKP
jgi:5-methylthioadenosine/S-adenosylhomocysteine deaminase